MRVAKRPGLPHSPANPSVRRAEKSQLAAAFAAGRFATIVELLPPKGFVGDDIIEQARALKIRGVDVVNIPDGPRESAHERACGSRCSCSRGPGSKPILRSSCRNRNLLGMQSDLLGAHAMGDSQRRCVVTGNAQHGRRYPDATGGLDVDSIGLTNVIAPTESWARYRRTGDWARPPASMSVSGSSQAPRSLDAEVRRFVSKVEAGAESCYYPAGLRRRRLRATTTNASKPAGSPLLAGRLAIREPSSNTGFMANEVPGVHVPDQGARAHATRLER